MNTLTQALGLLVALGISGCAASVDEDETDIAELESPESEPQSTAVVVSSPPVVSETTLEESNVVQGDDTAAGADQQPFDGPNPEPLQPEHR